MQNNGNSVADASSNKIENIPTEDNPNNYIGNGFVNDDSSFYEWLINHENKAKATYRSNLSAIRSAEKYALRSGYSIYKMFGNEVELARTVAEKLLEDKVFYASYAPYRSSLKKYLVFLDCLEKNQDSIGLPYSIPNIKD